MTKTFWCNCCVFRCVSLTIHAKFMGTHNIDLSQCNIAKNNLYFVIIYRSHFRKICLRNKRSKTITSLSLCDGDKALVITWHKNICKYTYDQVTQYDKSWWVNIRPDITDTFMARGLMYNGRISIKGVIFPITNLFGMHNKFICIRHSIAQFWALLLISSRYNVVYLGIKCGVHSRMWLLWTIHNPWSIDNID